MTPLFKCSYKFVMNISAKQERKPESSITNASTVCYTKRISNTSHTANPDISEKFSFS